jgi:hypothetical protein
VSFVTCSTKPFWYAFIDFLYTSTILKVGTNFISLGSYPHPTPPTPGTRYQVILVADELTHLSWGIQGINLSSQIFFSNVGRSLLRYSIDVGKRLNSHVSFYSLMMKLLPAHMKIWNESRVEQQLCWRQRLTLGCGNGQICIVWLTDNREANMTEWICISHTRERDREKERKREWLPGLAKGRETETARKK